MFHYTFHWRPALQALPQMLQGALVTLEIAILSMLVGVAIAIVLALMRNSKSRVLNILASIWIEVARNTPAV